MVFMLGDCFLGPLVASQQSSPLASRPFGILRTGLTRRCVLNLEASVYNTARRLPQCESRIRFMGNTTSVNQHPGNFHDARKCKEFKGAPRQLCTWFPHGKVPDPQMKDCASGCVRRGRSMSGKYRVLITHASSLLHYATRIKT